MDTPLPLPSSAIPSNLVPSSNQKKKGLKLAGLFILVISLILGSFYLGYRFAKATTIVDTEIPGLDGYLSIKMDRKGTLTSVDNTSLVLDSNGTRLKYDTASEVTVLEGPAQVFVHKNSDLQGKLKLNKPATISIQLKDGGLKVTNINYDFDMGALPKINPQPDTSSATGSARPGSDKLDTPLGIPKKQATPSADSAEKP